MTAIHRAKNSRTSKAVISTLTTILVKIDLLPRVKSWGVFLQIRLYQEIFLDNVIYKPAAQKFGQVVNKLRLPPVYHRINLSLKVNEFIQQFVVRMRQMGDLLETCCVGK